VSATVERKITMNVFTGATTDVAAVKGEHPATGIGVWGDSVGGAGVFGSATTNHGVHGVSVSGRGVVGISQSFFGMSGQSQTGVGVSGESNSNTGVWGKSSGSSPGVQGDSVSGAGVLGNATTNHGVHGESISGRGVVGISQSFVGVTGTCKNGVGGIGVAGDSIAGIGVFGSGGQLAGLFQGDVKVTGKIDCPTGTVHCFDMQILNADCAEDFDISGATAAEPGTVMVLNDAGELAASAHPYDRRVAGVVSGAGAYKPGIVLDRRETGAVRQPIALLGKVFCKVDAQFRAIEVGDLLTTSPTQGHAMATNDPAKSFGSVIGKALGSLKNGQGLIPILVSLQ
jgi:hypothetical protein